MRIIMLILPSCIGDNYLEAIYETLSTLLACGNDCYGSCKLRFTTVRWDGRREGAEHTTGTVRIETATELVNLE